MSNNSNHRKRPTNFAAPLGVGFEGFECVEGSFDSPSDIQPSLTTTELSWMNSTYMDDLPSTPCLLDLLSAESDFYSYQGDASYGSSGEPSCYGGESFADSSFYGSEQSPEASATTQQPQFQLEISLPESDGFIDLDMFKSKSTTKPTPQHQSLAVPATAMLVPSPVSPVCSLEHVGRGENTTNVSSVGGSGCVEEREKKAVAVAARKVLAAQPVHDAAPTELPNQTAPAAENDDDDADDDGGCGGGCNVGCGDRAAVAQPSRCAALLQAAAAGAELAFAVTGEATEVAPSSIIVAGGGLLVVDQHYGYAEEPLGGGSPCPSTVSRSTTPASLIDFPTLNHEQMENAIKLSTEENCNPEPTTVKKLLSLKIKNKRKSENQQDDEPEAKKEKLNEMTAADLERYERRKESNRKAATKLRLKKKMESEKLELEMKTILAENARLREEIASHQDQVARLETAMATHRAVCGINSSAASVDPANQQRL